jgi:hypothetical protein
LRALMIRASAEVPHNLVLSILSGQLRCSPQALPVTGCLGPCLHQPLWQTNPGDWPWGTGKTWPLVYLTNVYLKMHDLPLVYLRCMTSILWDWI